ncbi:MAG: RNA polymerase factor sigma-54, partial [Gammaproteobacteria bacterium]
MKQSLQLRLGQQLTMTPQLQQAIKLLQMSTIDLEQEIQQALESNMMLEVVEDDGDGGDEKDASASKKESAETATSEGSQTDIPDELPIDTTWEDVYDNIQSSMTGSNSDMPDFDNQSGESESLRDHLYWQLETALFSERDHAIATAIIDAVDEDGYLTSGIDDICLGLSDQLDELERDEVEAVLHRVQNFDPPGVAAVDLADCL